MKNSREGTFLDRKALNRREFLKYAGVGIAGGLAVVVVGSKLSWLKQGNTAYAAVAVQSIEMRISDAMKEMATHNTENDAQCYFWIYKCTVPDYAAESPGLVIMATEGDTVNITLTNDLDEPHSFYLPDEYAGTVIYDSGPIAPGATVTGSFVVSRAGAFMYYDNLNAPVNRLMGLYGALLVTPSGPAPAGHKLTPYSAPTPHVQDIYDAFGSTDYWPGLAWEEGDSTPWALDPTKPNTTPFRQYVWLLSQASPRLFAEVGSLAPGVLYDPNAFMDAFLRDPFTPHAFHSDNPGGNRVPQYFLVNGQSGFFAHFSPYITPMGRVGEPVVVHIMNAGLWTHSMHLHANHFYVTCVNGDVQENPIWVDVFNVHAMDMVDYTIPFMRPPDFPNVRGIGRPDALLISKNGTPVYPCVEEFDRYYPPLGTEADAAPGDPLGRTKVELGQRQSPLCYPMHDHSEPSQTAQGGNYNMGLISGIYITGDRNAPGFFDFPMDEDFKMGYKNARGCTYSETPAPPFGDYHDGP